jgi:hypothetical protein
MLTVCSVVFNDKKTQLFDYMVRSVLKFTEEEVQFIICDNGGNDLTKYAKDPRFKIISDVTDKYKGRGSLQHGESLNKIIDLVQPPYAIIESDVVVLNKDWYKLELNKKMLAAPKCKKDALDIYHVCFLVMTGSEKLDFRVGPKYGGKFKAQQDVGWQIGMQVPSKSVQLLEFVDCKTDGRIFQKLQSDEFYNGGNLIAAHFGRGSNLEGKACKNKYGTHEEQLNRWKIIADRLLEE